MIKRSVVNDLKVWRIKPDRKPLVLRGARQVGKTTAVRLFGAGFDQFVYLNLERPEDRGFFREERSFKDTLDAIYLAKKIVPGGSILIFIDEIQYSDIAVQLLRYFFEDAPELYVIAAGSMLETLINKKIHFPVGRVEFLKMYPVTFDEFLEGIGEGAALELLNREVIPEYAHDQLTRLFNRYTMVGGMPEAVALYSEGQSVASLAPVYRNLLLSYLDDVEKYASTDHQIKVLRHVISRAYAYTGSRIRYAGFGESSYGSRDVSEAFTILEKTMLFLPARPTVYPTIPVIPDYRKSMKVFGLDAGLINFQFGNQGDYLDQIPLTDILAGRMAEQITAQELIATVLPPFSELNFWIREKSQSQAEVDFVLPFHDRLIPIEVKSGKTGKLRSLHSFIDHCPHNLAVRIYSGPLLIHSDKTLRGKEFQLVNLPFYLISRIGSRLEGVTSDEKRDARRMTRDTKE
ncbi:MAG: AAA family ATPase [Bacteroidales bacterium]